MGDAFECLLGAITLSYLGREYFFSAVPVHWALIGAIFKRRFKLSILPCQNTGIILCFEFTLPIHIYQSFKTLKKYFYKKSDTCMHACC